MKLDIVIIILNHQCSRPARDSLMNTIVEIIALTKWLNSYWPCQNLIVTLVYVVVCRI